MQLSTRQDEAGGIMSGECSPSALGVESHPFDQMRFIGKGDILPTLPVPRFNSSDGLAWLPSQMAKPN